MSAQTWLPFEVRVEDYLASEHAGRPQPCVDCGRDMMPRLPGGAPDFDGFDNYVVRAAVWREAGMDGWDGGFLCSRDLVRRLGRRLRAEDFLARRVPGPAGRLLMEATPEYLDWVHAGSPLRRMP